jgi:hypothetical protein
MIDAIVGYIELYSMYYISKPFQKFLVCSHFAHKDRGLCLGQDVNMDELPNVENANNIYLRIKFDFSNKNSNSEHAK